MGGAIQAAVLRRRILLAMGLGSATALAGCGTSGTTPVPVDAGLDASAADAGATDAGADAAGDSGSVDDASDASGDGPASVRRPFLVGASLRAAAAVSRRDWARATDATRARGAAELDGATCAALASAWLADALEEHASIAAFARFSMHLLAVGAPPSLVAASQRASLDEIAHARGCFALARRYGAGDVGPGPLSLEGAMRLLELEELVDLAVEEGCVGETLGALLAAEQASLARDPEVAALLERIAADEARHAELSWRFLRWALETGGARVAGAARAAFARTVARAGAIAVKAPPADVAAWHAHGRTTCEEARRIVAGGIAGVLEPCFAAVLDAVSAPSATVEDHGSSPGAPA